MQANRRLASQSTKIPHLPKTTFHRPELVRWGAGLLQEKDVRRFANEKRKNVLAVPSHRPDIPRQEKKGGIRIVHLNTAQTSLEARHDAKLSRRVLLARLSW